MPGIDQYTQLMLHVDNNVTDFSQNSATVTNNSVTFSNIIFKFGYSAFFAGSNSDFLSVPNSSVFNFTGDFTIDFWANLTSVATPPCFIATANGSTGSAGFIFQYLSGGIQFLANYSAGAWGLNISGGSISTNIWTHLAVVRHGSAVNLYINGTSIASGVYGSTITIPGQLIIGNDASQSAGDFMTGYLDEIRVSNTARWTSNFTPPTAPYSAVPNPHPSFMDLYNFGFTWTDTSGPSATPSGGVGRYRPLLGVGV